MPDDGDPDDETMVVVTTAAAVAPIQVWDVLVTRTAEWWSTPYLGPDDGAMKIEPRLGGRVWSGTEPAAAGSRHGTVRAFDPPERLEIGSVLVPGAYTGSITITVEPTAMGSEIRIEQMARGRITASTEERMADGWTQMAAALADLADR